MSYRTLSIMLNERLVFDIIPLKKIKFSCKWSLSIPIAVSKITQATDVDDHPQQCYIAKSYHTSSSTISRAIKLAHFTFHKKQKVHKLTPSNARETLSESLSTVSTANQ